MTAGEYAKLRELLGLTQGELAELLGVTRKTINSRENGAKITREAMLAINMLSTEIFKGRSDYAALAARWIGVKYSPFRKRIGAKEEKDSC